MANLCWVVMNVLGEKENIEKFNKALNQQGDVWIGRGMGGSYDTIEPIYEKSNICKTTISGDTKWSVQSSLIDNAISMDEQKRSGKGSWADIKKDDKREFVDLVEACRKFGVDVELYSEEPGCCFEEHMSIIDGEMVENECVDMEEFDIGYLANEENLSRKEIENQIGRELSDDEWENEDYVKNGGFDDWKFWDIEAKIQELTTQKKLNSKKNPTHDPLKSSVKVATTNKKSSQEKVK